MRTLTLIDLGYEWYDKENCGERDLYINKIENGFMGINEKTFIECKKDGFVLLDTYGNEIKEYEDLF